MKRKFSALGGSIVLALGVVVAADQTQRPATPQTAAPSPKATSLSVPVKTTEARPAKPIASHAAAPSTGPSVEAQTQVVKTYCIGCHSDRGKAGGLTLASFDAATVTDHADIGEKMIHKLRAGMMPPAGAKRPDEATLAGLATALETRIDRAAVVSPNPGHRPFQRLNRAE